MRRGNKVFREVMKGVREGTSSAKEEARKAQATKEAAATKARTEALAKQARDEKAKREAEQKAVENMKKVHEDWKNNR